ncbi:MAG: hypothetical protein LH647_14940 [Leptolyngbyaceae cyanobacterium CAN_BIN12]|nr:hypothetical protein [Leptolyngbyaceae cyanobacterium CAN_BIN12]
MSNLQNNQRPLYTELTEEETTALNGGWHCRYVAFYQRICYWYGCFFRIAYAFRCY